MRAFVTVTVSLLLLVSLVVPLFAQDPPTGAEGDATQEAVPAVQATAQPTVVATAVPQQVAPVTGIDQTMPSIVDVVTANLVRLPEAVQAAGLSGELARGEYTLFAPNDGAFQTMLNDLDMSLIGLYGNRSLLEGVLLYHVVPGTITADDILNGLGSVETVHGATISFGLDPVTNRVTINGGEASIESTNLRASNGIVHIVDNVLLPPNLAELMVSTDAAETLPERSLIEISEVSFVRLTEAVQAAGLADELASGEYTLFAPNDGAFQTLLNDLDISYTDLLANQSLLTDVLSYHLVPGTVTADDILTGAGPLTTVNGATINFGFNPDTSRVIINGGEASVEQLNIFASNGIMHVIDNVLLPPQALTPQ
jgi:uncharacterized surface protein with fasciclin (FAS1) repeats